MDSKVEAFEKAVEEYFKKRVESAKNNTKVQSFGKHEANVDDSKSLGYCVFCQHCGGKYPMSGGWIDHAGGDMWGFGDGCAGAAAHYVGAGSHHLCCSKPSY